MFSSAQPKTPSHYGRRSNATGFSHTPQQHRGHSAAATPTAHLGTPLSFGGRHSPNVSAATPTRNIFSPYGGNVTPVRAAAGQPARHRIELVSALPAQVAEALSEDAASEYLQYRPWCLLVENPL
eukprot:Opistho-2@11936